MKEHHTASIQSLISEKWFKHGVIICAGTSEDTVYVKLKKTIQAICVLVFLKLPLPAINVAWIIMRNAFNDSVLCNLRSLYVKPDRRHRLLDNMTLLVDYNSIYTSFFEHTRCPHHVDKHNVNKTPFYYFWQVVAEQPVEEITIRYFQ